MRHLVHVPKVLELAEKSSDISSYHLGGGPIDAGQAGRDLL
jgi:hypothetical protein